MQTLHKRGFTVLPAGARPDDAPTWTPSLATVLPGTPDWPGFYYVAGSRMYWEAAPDEPSEAYRRAADTSVRDAALRWAKAGARRNAKRLTAHNDLSATRQGTP